MDHVQNISRQPDSVLADGIEADAFRPSPTQADLFGNEFILFHHWLGCIPGLDDRAVLLLSHLSYLATRRAGKDGWFFQADADVQRFTLMKRHKQLAARRRLVRAGVIEQKRSDFPRRIAYRVNFSLIALWREKRLTGSCDPESGSQMRRKPAHSTFIEENPAPAVARVRAHARLLPLVEVLYRDLFGSPITRAIRSELKVLASRPGLSEDDLSYAFGEATKGNAKALSYVLKILDRRAKPEPTPAVAAHSYSSTCECAQCRGARLYGGAA